MQFRRHLTHVRANMCAFENDSFEAIATLLVSSLGENLEQQFGSVPIKLHVAELINAKQIDAAVAGDGLGQHLLVGGLDQLVDQLGRQGVLDLEPGQRGLGWMTAGSTLGLASKSNSRSDFCLGKLAALIRRSDALRAR
ncbi:hypothetical protein [Nonomuraea angiospora]|uniref:hypothetical protein n=1 Tax=Nonomuraea angiospora TaxID=46172 RepID=UPI003EBFA58A